MKSFSEFVRKKRKKLDVSQVKLAELIGVSWVTIWRWEAGLMQPKPDAIDFWMDKIKGLK